MKTKICTKCLKRKTLDHFCKARRNKDGLYFWCNDCRKQYRIDNKEKIKEGNRKSYLKYHEKRLKARQKYNKEHREERIKYLREKNLKEPNYFRNSRLKNLFGITYLEYQKILKKQNNVCAICGNTESLKDVWSNGIRSLAVDHCHETNKVRGLLCGNCNTALGKFKDNIKLMKKAIKYLEKHK
jgi:hypothetical protein